MSLADRIVHIPPARVDEPGAELRVYSDNGELASIALAWADGPVIASGNGFRRGAGSPYTWLDCPTDELLSTFAGFLAHALDNHEEDARDAWEIVDEDAAGSWVDPLAILGEEGYAPYRIAVIGEDEELYFEVKADVPDDFDHTDLAAEMRELVERSGPGPRAYTLVVTTPEEA